MDGTLSFDRGIAEKFGVSAALLYNELVRKQFHWEKEGKLVDGWFYKDQKTIADWLLMSTSTLGRAAEALEGAGLIKRKTAYKPGTNETTTWWSVSQDFQNEIPGIVKMTNPRNRQNDESYIKANTTATTGEGVGSALDFGMMKAVIQKFIRDHQSQSNPITFTPSKLKEYYPALKEWAIDNGIDLDRQKILTVLENAYSEMTNDGWLAGKDMAIAFKDTCIGTRMKKQQKKGGLNDNEW